MLYYIISQNPDYTPCGIHEINDVDFSMLSLAGKNKSERAEILRTKVKTIARLARLFKTVKENHDVLIEIKEMSPDGRIPMGLILKGKPAIKD
jgi:hypothetical protein